MVDEREHTQNGLKWAIKAYEKWLAQHAGELTPAVRNKAMMLKYSLRALLMEDSEFMRKSAAEYAHQVIDAMHSAAPMP